MTEQLTINGLSKRFEPGTVNERIALDGITLGVRRGEFITILGSNGTGKSTLFNAILGKVMPDAGRILLEGEDITYKKDYKRALNIGCLFQNPLWGTAPHMTIEENLGLAYSRKASRSLFAVNRRDSAYFRELLAPLGLGLEHRLKAEMGTLSGGQRQAVSLLMATISRPKLLLLDEHTAALDPATSQTVLDITRRIVEESDLTTLMITHDMNLALEVGSRTIMMDAGRLALDVSGEQRAALTPKDLAELFTRTTKKHLSDRETLSIQ